MKERDILGHIDCPSCGTVKGMRITHDKNGDPFGFCEEECAQQLRVGGNFARVKKFVKRYPWAAKPGTAPAPAVEPVTEPQPTKNPVTVTGPQPKPKREPVAGPFDFLLNSKKAAA